MTYVRDVRRTAPVVCDKANKPTHGTGRGEIISNAVIGLRQKAQQERQTCTRTHIGADCEVSSLLDSVATSILRIRAELNEEQRVIDLRAQRSPRRQLVSVP